MEEAYELWSSDSEKYSLQRATGSTLVPAPMRGRGKLREEKHSSKPPWAEHVECGAGTHDMHLIQGCLRKAEELARKFHLRGAEGLQSEDAQSLWSNRQRDAQGASLTRLLISNPQNCTQRMLDDQCQRFQVALKVTRRQLQELRRETRWKHFVDSSWQSPSKKEVYEFCGETAGAVAVLQKKDGTLTGAHGEMDDMLREAWRDTFQMYTALPEPSWEAFRERYGRYFPRTRPMTSTVLTPAILRGTLERMKKGTSCGGDGWRVMELQALPDELLARLCELFALIERVGQWPSALAMGLVTPLSKGEGMKPIDTRPITVMSTVYRLWAGTRVAEVIAWQAEWLGSDVCSYRVGFGCDDIWWCTALDIEHSLLMGEPLAGLSIDFAKAFDRLPITILLNLAEAAGVSSGMLTALRGMYGQLRRRWKIHGFLGDCFASTNGIMQGCPLSVAFLNIFAFIWTRIMREEVPGSNPKAFADDLSLSAPSCMLVKKAVALTQEYATLTGMLINAKKSSVWATTTGMRMRLTDVQVDNVKVPLVTEDRLLGGYLSFNWKKTKSRVDITFKQCVTIAERIAYLPLPLEVRATLVGSLVIPKAAYACAINWPSKKVMGKLRSKCTTTVWGQANGWRAPEIVHTLLCKGHLVDPQQVMSYQTYLVACRVLRRHPEALHKFRTVLLRRMEIGSNTGPKGPVHSFMRAMKANYVVFAGDDLMKMNHHNLDLRKQEGWPWLSGKIDAHLHEVREGLRTEQWKRLAHRRASFAGIEAGIDRAATMTTYKKGVVGLDRYRLRTIHTGGVATMERLHKRGQVESPVCICCNMGGGGG